MPAKDGGLSWRKRHPEKVREYKKDWEQRNRSQVKTKVKALITAKRQFLAEYKESKGCMDCGNKFPSFVLDFDHRPGEHKVGNLGKLTTWGWEALRKEVTKCDVVCANCHRFRTVLRMREVGGETR